jgi:8-oxo-dGTP diphosphatase
MSSDPNPFESGDRKIIPAVLIYVLKDDCVLMIHRTGNRAGREDFHSGKWNGLGGKLEVGESALEAAKRELLEESGLNLSEERFQSQGVIHFPQFKPHKKEDWMVFLFTAHCHEDEVSQIMAECEEGTLHWVSAREVTSLNLWPGDRLFIDEVLAQSPLTGTIWYREGQVERSWIQKLKPV